LTIPIIITTTTTTGRTTRITILVIVLAVIRMVVVWINGTGISRSWNRRCGIDEGITNVDVRVVVSIGDE